MSKPLKFRYTSQIAGSFVLLAVLLSLAAIFAASHKQGWFEGTFTLRAEFDAKTGALGLREGNDVMILSTLAGRVGRVTPTEGGDMETEFIVKNRFRQFVRADSVAKVKKKFVAAGDSYVEIEPGQGKLLAAGDYIVCTRDEEIMETAQKVLADIQTVVVPLVEEVQEVLEHLNGILTDIEEGEGVATALINDEEMANDVKSVVQSANAVIEESEKTFHETTRLIKGLQKSWLVRKHIDQDGPGIPGLSPIYMSDEAIESISESSRDSLEEARVRNDPVGIGYHGCQLAYAMLMSGRSAEVRLLLDEVMTELTSAGLSTAYANLLQAELLKRSGSLKEALQFLLEREKDVPRSERELKVQYKLMAAGLMCDLNDLNAARDELSEAAYFVKKIKSDSAAASSVHLMGRIYDTEKNYKAAAGQYDAESRLRRSAGQFTTMTRALYFSGRAYENAEKFGEAADRYFRSGRSLLYYGEARMAENYLLKALSAAKRADDVNIINQATAILNKARE